MEDQDLFKLLKQEYISNHNYTRDYLEAHDDIEDMIDQFIGKIFFQITGRKYEG